MLRSLDRVINVIEFYRGRSEKDGDKSEDLTSIADRLRVLQSDISRLVADGALDEFKDDCKVFFPSYR